MEFHLSNYHRYVTSQGNIDPRSTKNYTGIYVIFEGNSGTGKNTHIEYLSQKLMSNGHSVAIVNEPSSEYRQLETNWELYYPQKIKDDESLQKLFLLIADRRWQVYTKIIPALQQGKIVLSNRSFISSLVYQCRNEATTNLVLLLHDFVPAPDHVFLLDASPYECSKRIANRKGEQLNLERLKILEETRQKYFNHINYLQNFFPIEIISTEKSMEAVSKEIFSHVNKLLVSK